MARPTHSTSRTGGRPFGRLARLFTLGSLVACGGRSDDVRDRIDLIATPIAIEDTLLFVDRENDRGFLLAHDSDGSATEIDLPHGPTQIFRRNGAGEALVLASGRRGSASEDAEPATLCRVTPQGEVTTYVVGNPFDALRQSDDGRHALLFKSGRAERLLDNPNEIAIVDLDREPGDDEAVTLRTLRSFGDSPVDVVFSPRMNVVGEDRRLAIVMSETNVTLVDLDHLDRRETTVRLSTPGGAAVRPSQVVFGEDDGTLYVRGNGSDDLFVFNLTPRIEGGSAEGDGDGDGDGAGPRNDFRPSINQLGVGSGPSDLALYDTGDGTRLLVVAQASQVVSLVEANTSRVTMIPLEAAAGQVLLFEASAPGDGEAALRALIYQQGSAVVTFLDLEGAEERGTRNLETLELDRAITKLIPMPDERLALVIHEQDGVSLIDLAGRTVSPISANVTLNDAMFDARRRRLWVAPTFQPWVGLLDLDTGDTDEVLLDQPISAAVPMFDAGRLALIHDSPLGHVSWVDLEKPERETARAVRGFLVSNLLDRGEP